jgi:uncharacterized protein (DUF2249 family)
MSGEPRERGLDVREDIRRGEEPFGRIVAALDALSPEEVLVLRAPFEPRPLYRLLDRRGLAHRAECRGPGDWWVWISGPPRGAARAPGAGSPPAGAPACLDVRGLEPPEPMVRVLEAVDRLGPGQALEILHDRRPVFLYPQLEERGFAHETDEPAPGLVRIVVRRGGPGP